MNTSTHTAITIPILNSLEEAKAQDTITKSLRHFNLVLHTGDEVTLHNVTENKTVKATVTDAGDYATNTVFIIS